MKTLRVLAIIMLAATSAMAAERSIDETRPARADGVVDISNVCGSVEVLGWDKEEVHVMGTLERNVERVDFDSRNGRTWIKVIHRNRTRKDKAAYLTIHVPSASRLDVETVSAEVDVADVGASMDVESVSGEVTVELLPPPPQEVATREGDAEAKAEVEVVAELTVGEDREKPWGRWMPQRVRIKTVSGDILLNGDANSVALETVSGEACYSGSASEMEAKTVSGDIHVNGDLGSFSAAAVSGDITVDGVAGEGVASTTSGDVDLSLSALGEGDFKTTSGDVSFVGELAASGELVVSTVSGDVELRFPKDIPAVFHLWHRSGDVVVDLGPPHVHRHAEEARGLSFSTVPGMGSGTSIVEVRTKSGDIDVRKR
jgi:DUF4097 and DUF4098 domain-containing protein YvlB